MARKAVVFVSHSSEDAARATALSKAIEEAEEGGVKTTIDLRDLRKGELWRSQLYRWIARCDAGFLLLTDAVMRKPGWVLEEATLLRARQIYHGDKNFPLYVLIEPGVRDTATWKALFEPLSLTEIQRTDATLTNEQIAQTIVEACQSAVGRQSDDYFSRLRDYLSDAVQPFLKYSAFAKSLQDQLDDGDGNWKNIVGDESALANTLAQRLCEARETSAIGSFGGLDDLFSAFERKGIAEERRNLLHALRPYWVNLGAALKLVPVTLRPEGTRLCALPTSRPELSPDLHIDRFFSPYAKRPLILRVAAGNESFVDLSAQLLAAWNESRPAWPPMSVEQLNDQLKNLTVKVVAVLPPLEVAYLARQLARAFPRITFIVPVARTVNLKDADWSGIAVIEPTRRDEEEQIFASQYETATTFASIT